MREMSSRPLTTACLTLMCVVLLRPDTALAAWDAWSSNRQWGFEADMNRDGAVTISDVGLWIKWLFFYPGDILIGGIGPSKIGTFLELTPASFGGLGSGVLSVLGWVLGFVILGNAVESAGRPASLGYSSTWPDSPSTHAEGDSSDADQHPTGPRQPDAEEGISKQMFSWKGAVLLAIVLHLLVIWWISRVT